MTLDFFERWRGTKTHPISSNKFGCRHARWNYIYKHKLPIIRRCQRRLWWFVWHISKYWNEPSFFSPDIIYMPFLLMWKENTHRPSYAFLINEIDRFFHHFHIFRSLSLRYAFLSHIKIHTLFICSVQQRFFAYHHLLSLP